MSTSAVGSTRRRATVTSWVPEAAMAPASDSLDGNFPVPRKRRDEKARPPTVSGSVMAGSSSVIGHLLGPHDRPGLTPCGSRVVACVATSQPGAPGSPGGRPQATRGGRRYRGPVSTRALIATALVCGLAILLAFTVQVVVAR